MVVVVVGGMGWGGMGVVVVVEEGEGIKNGDGLREGRNVRGKSGMLLLKTTYGYFL